MTAYAAKDRLIAKIEAAAKAKICCPVGSYGFLLEVRDRVAGQSRAACYIAEKAILEAEKPGRWGQHDVFPGDYLGFFKSAGVIDMEGPADGDWSAWLAAHNID